MSRRDELRASLLAVLNRAGRIKYLQFSHALTAEEFFPEVKAEIKSACLAFLNLLELRARLPIGVGPKHLDDDYWEIRKGLRYRILFRWRKDSIEFIVAGDHDSIKDFLKIF